MIRSIASIVFLALIGVRPSLAAVPSDWTHYARQAHRDLQAQRWRASAQNYQRAIQLQAAGDDPVIALRLRMNRAVALRGAHSFAESLLELKHVEQQLQMTPGVPFTLEMRLRTRKSETYEAVGDYAAAIKELRQVTGLVAEKLGREDPIYFDALDRLQALLTRRGDLGQLLKVWTLLPERDHNPFVQRMRERWLSDITECIRFHCQHGEQERVRKLLIGMNITRPWVAISMWSAILRSCDMNGPDGGAAHEAAERIIQIAETNRVDGRELEAKHSYYLALQCLFWYRVRANLLDDETINLGRKCLANKGLPQLDRIQIGGTLATLAAQRGDVQEAQTILASIQIARNSVHTLSELNGIVQARLALAKAYAKAGNKQTCKQQLSLLADLLATQAKIPDHDLIIAKWAGHMSQVSGIPASELRVPGN